MRKANVVALAVMQAAVGLGFGSSGATALSSQFNRSKITTRPFQAQIELPKCT